MAKSTKRLPEPVEPEGLLIGYARVSTSDQSLDAQIAALTRGMQHRKTQGAKFGREYALSPEDRKAVREAVKRGEKPSAIAKRFGISRGSVYNYSRKRK